MRKIIMVLLTAALVAVGLSVGGSPAHAAHSCMKNGDDVAWVTVGPWQMSVCSQWEWAFPDCVKNGFPEPWASAFGLPKATCASDYWEIGSSNSLHVTSVSKQSNQSGVYMTERVMPGDRSVKDLGRQYPAFQSNNHPHYILTSGKDYMRYDLQWRDPSNGKVCRGFVWQDRYTFTKQSDPLPCSL